MISLYPDDYRETGIGRVIDYRNDIHDNLCAPFCTRASPWRCFMMRWNYSRCIRQGRGMIPFLQHATVSFRDYPQSSWPHRGGSTQPLRSIQVHFDTTISTHQFRHIHYSTETHPLICRHKPTSTHQLSTNPYILYNDKPTSLHPSRHINCDTSILKHLLEHSNFYR